MTEAMSALRRDFLMPDLQPLMRQSGIDGTVAVQARQSIEETDWLLEQARSYPSILGVVGWVPLCDPGVALHLDRFAQNRKLRAVRHVLHDEPDDLFMLRDDFNRGIDLLPEYGLAYDILVFERHLPQTIQFVDRHPRQSFIVDHIAKPRIRDQALSPWKENIQELARRDNVWCKISGMVTEADWTSWTAGGLRPYFDAVLAAFGPKRLMFGSDWAVLTLAATYSAWVDTFRTLIAGLTPNEQEQVCSGTAKAAYRLD